MSALRQPTPPADPPSVAALPATPLKVLEAIRTAYTFAVAVDERGVMSILATRPDIASVLMAALPQVYAIFGDGTQVFLVTIDEHNSDPIRLSALTISAADQDTRRKIFSFYTNWWNDASGPVLGELSFGITYT